MANSKVADFLKQMDIFQRLPEGELEKITKLLKERKFSENQVVVQQGDDGDSMYIITHGRVKIAINDQFGREKVLAFLGEGQPLGDMALLTGAPRSATATASTDVKALQLRKDDFDVLLAGNVELMREMMQVVAARQTAINQRVSEEASADSGRVKGLMTAIFSPRGGSGRSTIASNVAIALAQQSPERVALVDLDLVFGQQTVMLNLNPRTSLAAASPSALRSLDRESFAYYLSTHDESSLRVLIGASRPEEGELVTADHIRIMSDLMRRQFVQVIVDTNSTFSDANLAVPEAADSVLMLVTPELPALRDIRECQRIFFELLGFDRTRFEYVLNHPFPYQGVSRDEIEQVIEAPIAYEIPYGSDAPSQAALEGTPLVSRWPNNNMSKSILGLAGVIDRKAKEALALASR